MKSPILFVVFIITIVLITISYSYGQPGLPSPPSQAPIDGGLGLLAAAGGAYVYKKLKNRNNLDQD